MPDEKEFHRYENMIPQMLNESRMGSRVGSQMGITSGLQTKQSAGAVQDTFEKRELQVVKPSIYFSAIEAKNKVIEMSLGAQVP